MSVWYWLWAGLMAVMCVLVLVSETVGRKRRRRYSPFRFNGTPATAALFLAMAAVTLVFFVLM